MQRSGERHVSAKGLAQTRVHSEAREAPAPDLTLYASCCTKPFAVLGRGVMLMTRSRGCRAKGRALRKVRTTAQSQPEAGRRQACQRGHGWLALGVVWRRI